MKTGRILHLCMDIQGFIQGHPRLSDYRGVFTRPDGSPATAEEGRQFLFDELRKGRRVIPMAKDCEGFDYQKGCPGHPYDHTPDTAKETP